MSPALLAEMISSIDPKAQPQVLMDPAKEDPATYAFQTREGRHGHAADCRLHREPGRGEDPLQAGAGSRGSISRHPTAGTHHHRLPVGNDAEHLGTLLRRECSARLCLENLDFDKAKDGITIAQAIEQLEGAAKKRRLTPAEQNRLSLALKLLSEGNPKTMIFDVGSRHSGQFTPFPWTSC